MKVRLTNRDLLWLFSYLPYPCPLIARHSHLDAFLFLLPCHAIPSDSNYPANQPQARRGARQPWRHRPLPDTASRGVSVLLITSLPIPPHDLASRHPQDPNRTVERQTDTPPAIRSDAADPDLDLNALTNRAFSQRLKQMGVATPNPTLSRSSTAHPSPSASSSSSHPTPARFENRTLSALEARRQLQQRAEAEFENPVAAGGREFLDIGTVKQIVTMRDRGSSEGEIEKRLRLKDGVVGRLGRKGVVVAA
ncbi:hypothetical protein F5Y15DRAFT_124647 [Xylariaceae sp. FL0016]|nr:hypothetical protein F5Y15DRAFT_124647 [Xylariaceae sp. FL0016]